MMVDDQVSSGTHQHLVLPYFNDNRIKYNYLLQGGKFDPWDQIKISSCMWLFPKKGVTTKHFLCENKAHTYVLTLLGGDLSMAHTLSCPSNKWSCFSWITFYVYDKWYSSHTRISLHTLHIFIFGWWYHDATSTPNLFYTS